MYWSVCIMAAQSLNIERVNDGNRFMIVRGGSMDQDIF